MRILVFGASVVQGFHDTECGGWVNRLAGYTNEKIRQSDAGYSNTIFNLGISGDCSTRLLKRFETEVKTRIEGRDGAIVLCLGTNDIQKIVSDNSFRTSKEQFTDNVSLLLAQARQYTDTVHAFGILPVVEDLLQPLPWATDRSISQQDAIDFDNILKQVCIEEDVGYSHMQDVFSGQNKMYLHDGIHPNTEGHRLIFERVKVELGKVGIL